MPAGPPPANVQVARVDPASPEARACLAQYFAELDRRFEGGFDPGNSPHAADAALRPPTGSFLVATLEGEPVACGGIRTLEPGVGYIKRMWVSGTVRGAGLGARMLAALEDEARALGHHTVKLETNRALVEAIAFYRRAGYVEVDPFIDEPYAHHWFAKRLG